MRRMSTSVCHTSELSIIRSPLNILCKRFRRNTFAKARLLNEAERREEQQVTDGVPAWMRQRAPPPGAERLAASRTTQDPSAPLVPKPPSTQTEAPILHDTPKWAGPVNSEVDMWCEICKTKVAKPNWADHVVGRSHRFMVTRRKLESEGIATPPPPHISLRERHVWCGVCQAQVGLSGKTGSEHWDRHVNGETHKLFEFRLKLKQADKAGIGSIGGPTKTVKKAPVKRQGLKIG